MPQSNSNKPNLTTTTPAQPQMQKNVKGKTKNPEKWTGKAKQYGNEEIKRLLNGYIMVPPDAWENIPPKSHIRYFKKPNLFRRGGFVVNHWLTKDTPPKPAMQLANNFNSRAPNYMVWPVVLENVARIYKKTTQDSTIEMDVVRHKTGEIIGEINKLVDFAKKMDARLTKMERAVYILNEKVRKSRR